MSTQNKSLSETIATPRPDASEPHHGDLRKRAYLKRRAAYQMQAQQGSARQAGCVSGKPHPQA